MKSAYINSIGKFLPGEAIDNNSIEQYLGKINGKPSKVKQKILQNNGIKQRYYALDRQQNNTYSNSDMAARAVKNALAYQDINPTAIDLLACATTLPDLLIPGFASMVHGQLPEFNPLEIFSTQGVCCAGVTALNYAVSQIKLGQKKNAIAVASELASRLFINSKFEAETRLKNGKKLDFDTEFLRWMLSDGAGACLIQNSPNPNSISLKVDWIELISYGHNHPLCMYAGTKDETGKQSWLDYPNYIDAVTDGAFNLRQNIRLLDEVLKLGVAGWLRLIEAGKIKLEEIDWFLCHYSSHFFRSKIVDLLEQAKCLIPESKWFTNLYTRGNTGCASIYLMLEELFNSGKLLSDQKICCFIPESGRFTIAYMMLTVVGNTQGSNENKTLTSKINLHDPYPVKANLLRQLLSVWLEFEQRLNSVTIVRKLNRGEFTLENYQALLRNLRPQVVEGARWIARAASNLSDFELRSIL